MRIAGESFGAKICEALGIDCKGVFGVELRCFVGSVVEARVHRRVFDDEADKLVSVLENYTVEEKEE